MPQMMPMSWLMLFLMFLLSFFLFAVMNYYTSIHKTKTLLKKKVSSKMMIWKW
uniref:ATP synthase F0 subunit 8 n=1 Tax=Incisitermes nr. barretti TaxID=2942756 RepID=A0A8X8RGL0_9NEOP|nr:ATP synthase F0 subunit 8 [Incisitermes nr. barretti]